MDLSRFKKYGGLVSYDHKNKLIRVKRSLTPAKSNERLLNRLKEDFPEYKVVKNW